MEEVVAHQFFLVNIAPVQYPNGLLSAFNCDAEDCKLDSTSLALGRQQT